jgi:hypothetical protein
MRILPLVVIGGVIAALVATRQRRLQWRQERRQARADVRRARRGEAPGQTPPTV